MTDMDLVINKKGNNTHQNDECCFPFKRLIFIQVMLRVKVADHVVDAVQECDATTVS